MADRPRPAGWKAGRQNSESRERREQKEGKERSKESWAWKLVGFLGRAPGVSSCFPHSLSGDLPASSLPPSVHNLLKPKTSKAFRRPSWPLHGCLGSKAANSMIRGLFWMLASDCHQRASGELCPLQLCSSSGRGL